MGRWTLGVVLTLALAGAGVRADDFREYPEFRYTSGLPGGGYGVTADGSVGFAGAAQLCIPVGYTPGTGNYALTGNSGSINGGLTLDTSGADVNGNVTFGFGLSLDRYKVWLADMETGEAGESAYNIQVQIVPEGEKWPGIAVGVVDLLNQRAADRFESQVGDARSFYAAATRRFGDDANPWYLTAGVGTGRYSPLFFGGNYQVNRWLKVTGEYDSLGCNAGVIANVWPNQGHWHAVAFLGVVDMERPTIGLTVTRTGSLLNW